MTDTNFSWGAFVRGLAIALVIGVAGNILTGVAAILVKSHILGALIGAIAGAVLIGIALAMRRSAPAFSRGLFCGGCVIALLGGGCGAALVGITIN